MNQGKVEKKIIKEDQKVQEGSMDQEKSKKKIIKFYFGILYNLV